MWENCVVFVCVPVVCDNAVYVGDRRKQSQAMSGDRGAGETNR